MKIIIKPTDPTLTGATVVTIDTMCDDETTPEIVDAALRAIIAAGHQQVNVVRAARDWAGQEAS